MRLQLSSHVVDVYPYRYVESRREWLIMRRAAGTRYSASWRMIGGRVLDGEAAWQAALRELKEETQLTPIRAWTVPSANLFYEWQSDLAIAAPAFAVEVAGEPTLDHEHDAWRWLPASEAASHLGWPEQRRLLRLANELLSSGALVEEWLLPV